MIMKILLAPDKFKGTLSADRVCELIEAGLRTVLPGAAIVSCPIADGGDGFAEVIRAQLGGLWVKCEVHDAIGRPLRARYALCGDTAVMEMSEASGIRHIPEGMRDIWSANTYGTGQMMRHAIEQHHVRRIIMGIGGSVSNDAGCGMAVALGVRFFDAAGERLEPMPKQLIRCASIDDSGKIPLPEILVACDVDNPLLGNQGAVRVYAPQKGAAEADLPALESMLGHLVELTHGEQVSRMPGAGAAGGLGFGLVQFGGARLVAGFELVAAETGLLEKIRGCDVVITGEGKLDAQTLRGKGPAGVARMARAAGKPVAVIAGIVDFSGLSGRAERAEREAAELFDHICALHDGSRPLEQTIRRGEALLMEKSAELARELGAISGAS